MDIKISHGRNISRIVSETKIIFPNISSLITETKVSQTKNVFFVITSIRLNII